MPQTCKCAALLPGHRDSRRQPDLQHVRCAHQGLRQISQALLNPSFLDKHPLVRPSLEAMCGTGARTLTGSNAPMHACMTSFFGLLPYVPISSCNYIISSPARPAGAAEWQRCRQAPPPAVATLGSEAVLEDWVRSGDFGTTLHRRSASPTKAKVSFAPVYFGLLMLCCFFTFSGRLRKRIGEPSSPGWIRPGV
jgi:hypothetical protein